MNGYEQGDLLAAAAIDKAEQHADAAWLGAAKGVVWTLIKEGHEFTTDDCWARLAAVGVTTHEPRALGAVVRAAARQGLDSADRGVPQDEPHRSPLPAARCMGTCSESGCRMNHCAIPGCEKPRRGRTWCGGHYENWRRNGDPIPYYVKLPSYLDRVMALVTQDDESGCWEYEGYHDRKGYAYRTMKINRVQKTWAVYRFLYEHMEGPIPAGLHIDHLCRNPRCVNPGHLEPVEPAENTRRGEPANRTHCPRGHVYNAENTGWQGPRKRSRYCLTCHRARQAARNEARRVARALRKTNVA